MRSCCVVVAVAFLLCLCGCGGSTSTPPSPNPSPQFTIVSGHWAMALTAQQPFPAGISLLADGAVSQSGTALSGILHTEGSTCFDDNLDDLLVSGTVVGSTFTLNTASLRGQVLSITATPVVTQAGAVIGLSGTWSLTGGPCASSGMSTLLFTAPLNGTWSGPLTNGLTGTVSATLTQTGPDAHGFFPVAGNFTFSGLPCFVSGAIASGSLRGLEVNILLNTSDSGQTQVIASHLSGPAGERLSAIFGVFSGTCSPSVGQATLTKQ